MTHYFLFRYFKFLNDGTQICGVKTWFAIHRTLMVLVPLLSVIAFLVILSDLNWRWIREDEPLEFAHSIFGIFTISFSIIQVFNIKQHVSFSPATKLNYS